MSRNAHFSISRSSRWRVRALFALACVLALAGVWATAWHADRRERETHIDDLAARVRTAANASALAVGSRLRVIDQLLIYAAANHERDAQRFRLDFWFAQARSVGALSAQFALIDRSGTVRQSSAGPSAVGRDLSGAEPYRAHRHSESEGLHVGRVTVDPATGRRAIHLSRRVNDRSGAFAGVLVFSADPDFFFDVLDRVKVGIRGGGAMRREGGDAILRLTDAGRFVGGATEFDLSGRFESADAAYVGNIYDAEVVRATRGLEDYDGIVVDAEGNVAEALAEIARRRALIWLAAAVVTILILALFVALTADLARLRRLRGQLENRNRELILANRAAHAAVEAKSRFLANMSHEFRTPLNAILGFSEALKSGLFGHLNPRQSDYAGHIHSSGNHLLALINDVLDISRLDLDAYVLNPERIELAAAVAANMRTLSVAAEQKGVSLVAEVPAAIPAIMADERGLKQVLLNLLSNAVKFTPAGGVVTVTAAQHATGEVAIVVADTGLGVAPEDMARLFQPFQQAENTRRHNPEGTGLGLVISRRLMEKHGGTLTLESALGQGTRAIAVFPASAVVPAAADAKAPRRAAAMAA